MTWFVAGLGYKRRWPVISAHSARTDSCPRFFIKSHAHVSRCFYDRKTVQCISCMALAPIICRFIDDKLQTFDPVKKFAYDGSTIAGLTSSKVHIAYYRNLVTKGFRSLFKLPIDHISC